MFTTHPPYVIAIDIAKRSLALHTEHEACSLPYDEDGLAGLLERLRGRAHPLVVCEATGGYERPLLAALAKAKIPVALVSPARVRAFAKSEGIKAKTDPIDAKMLWRFAQEKKLRATPPPSPGQAQLIALLDRRSQLSVHLAQEKNRLEKEVAGLRPSLQRTLKFLQRELTRIETQIRALIEADPQLREQQHRCLSVQGVGEVTTWSVLGYLNEICVLNRNQLVALAGLAPYNRDSGDQRPKRSIFAGRAKVRKVLYMAAHTAARCNPVIRDYVAKLLQRGKPYKCALVAAMRKLLLHLQALLKKPQFSPCT
jgi:transposase